MTLSATNIYTGKIEAVQLSLLQILRFRLLGITSYEKRSYPDFKGAVQFYLYKCNACKELHLDYPHGYSQILHCIKERKELHPSYCVECNMVEMRSDLGDQQHLEAHELQHTLDRDL